jgi:hypothetical protein
VAGNVTSNLRGRAFYKHPPGGLTTALEHVSLKLGAGLRAACLITNLAAVPAALACFYAALYKVAPDGLARVSARYLELPGVRLPVQVANAATWVIEYGIAIARPEHGLASQRPAALGLVAAGIALLTFANWATWQRQTPNNYAVRAALCMWAASVGLSFFDLYRSAALPITWDTAPFLYDVSNGTALRCAEIVLSAYLVSLTMVLRVSRVAPHIVRPWGQVSSKARRQLIIGGTILLASNPWLVPFIHRLVQSTETTDPTRLAAALLIDFLLILVIWKAFLSTFAAGIAALIKFGWQIVATLPPLRTRADPNDLLPPGSWA